MNGDMKRRYALFALFAVPGLSISSWVTRTPAIRDLIGASTAEMGLVLFGLSVGSMMGVLASGPLVARLGTKPVVVGGMLGIVVSSPTIGLGAETSSALIVGVGLFLFGLGMGVSEIAMNVEGADVEDVLKIPTLPPMHGFFSLGTLVGATAGMVLTVVNLPVAVHLLSVGILSGAIFAISIRRLPSGIGRRQGPRTGKKTSEEAAWKDPKLLLIGFIVLAMAFSEGTANDWLPLLMVDGHGFAPGSGAAVYMIFAGAMTAGRFLGTPVLARWGARSSICGSAVLGSAGLTLVIVPDSQVFAVTGVILWGLGAALGFPVAISAAGSSGANPTARVALVSTVGYLAFLVGPPVLGTLGEHYGLRLAMLAVLTLLVVTALASSALKMREPTVVPKREHAR
ncbi:MFS transporter [Pseudarthrobacter sp. R1]|uniref:MFS transporter n=1 Tax=Pseudarthrobacter sp. R1 TaxID=2944934 RepID=UPI00210E3911|nr:MFS transporter [Pseudarthrobacter sp. R1]MCQ6272316.1 MFS transporter [Pseudarthrobacter sp. R1]